MPSVVGSDSRRWTMRLSFSPASTKAPSVRSVPQACALASPSMASIAGIASQPSSMTSSTKASRVPEVGGGPKTWMATSGSDGSMSDQLVFGLSTIAAAVVGKLRRERAEDLLFREIVVGIGLVGVSHR